MHNEGRFVARKLQAPKTEMRNKHKGHLLLLFGLVLLLASSLVACSEQAPPPSPTIAASPVGFSFSAQEEGSNPPSQALSIWNCGDRTLNWSISDSAAWLALSPASGSSAGETNDITLSVDTFGMGTGNYAAVIIISASEASNTPQTVVVNLIINPPPKEEEQVIDALDTGRLLDIGYNHPDKVVTVEGVIVRTYYAKKSKGQPTFLDFHDPYEGYFKCIIWKEERQTGEPIRHKFIEAFPPNPETHFLNKKVRVKGSINVYHGDPEIVLCDPSQIWIVQ